MRLETISRRGLVSGESPAGYNLDRRHWLLYGGLKGDKARGGEASEEAVGAIQATLMVA